MKIRIGFVSNSSSSSFVISIPKEMENRPLPFYIKVDGDLKDHTNWTIHNGRELSDYISEYNLDSEGERVCAMRKAIENGRVVLVGNFCDEEGYDEAAFCKIGLSEDGMPEGVTIIESEGGY